MNGQARSESELPSGWLAVQTVAGAVIGALASATTGCRIGSALGQELDDRVLQRWLCHSCGFSFGNSARSPPSMDSLDDEDGTRQGWSDHRADQFSE
ncbi:MAG: hypothetical protein K5880_02275 [Hydrogenophaga sp.]|nr:hypothetical protein [Hydrogenophaga sp.]